MALARARKPPVGGRPGSAGARAPRGQDVGGILGPVQQSGGALVELLAARPAAEPAITLGGALGSLPDGLRSAFQATHRRLPLRERRPHTQPSPRRPEAVARA